MKNKLLLIVCYMLMAGMSAGCACKHDFSEATCVKPQICRSCGQTQGEAKGHDFGEATCTEPATCKVCGETQGEVKGHDFGEATCTKPATCKVCGETQGEAKGHDFSEATCSEPKTCKICGTMEGEALGHSSEFGECSRCGKVQGKEIIESIINYIKIASREINLGSNNSEKIKDASSYNEMYDILCESTELYKAAAADYDAAIGLCGTYSELSELKTALEIAKNSCPGNPVSADSNSIKKWVVDEAVFRLNELSVEELAIKLGAKIEQIISF